MFHFVMAVAFHLHLLLLHLMTSVAMHGFHAAHGPGGSNLADFDTDMLFAGFLEHHGQRKRIAWLQPSCQAHEHYVMTARFQRDRCAGWHDDILALLGATPADALYKWGLFDRDPLDCWVFGRIALLGDAAHPMLPFMAQGAAMAIED